MNALLRKWPAALAVICATAYWTTATGVAQQQLRTGDGLLQMSAALPEEVRVGEQFSYTIEVQNISDDVVLHDIQLEQKQAQGFVVESTSVEPGAQAAQATGRSRTSDARQGRRDAARRNQPEAQQSQPAALREDRQPAQRAAQRQNEQQESEQVSCKDGKIVIAMLGPGQSQRIRVTASADQQGQLQSCLEVVSYKPALCLTANVVKPELEITKQAPERVSRCEVIELKYTVTNGGTGNVEAFQVVDELGEGLRTIDGEQTLNFQVDGLKAGDTREFLARVYATRAGSYSSRAVAQASQSQLNSRSQQTTTEVIAADLIVQVDGPGRLYGSQLAQFNASVTNNGNVAAEKVNVHVSWPTGAVLADLGQARISQGEVRPRQSVDSRDTGTPTLADVQVDRRQSAAQRQVARRGAEQQRRNDLQDRAFVIERLEPGQTATFSYALRTGRLERIPTEVEASFVCAVEQADDQARARDEVRAMATATATIVRLPALQVVVVDDEDPVANNSEVVYSIRVINEGDAAESQVQIKAELPEGLEFKDARGPTEHEVNGSAIAFQPVETLEAGEHLDYRVVATTKGSKSVVFVTKLSAESLDQEVVSEEPTRLFDEQSPEDDK